MSTVSSAQARIIAAKTRKWLSKFWLLFTLVNLGFVLISASLHRQVSQTVMIAMFEASFAIFMFLVGVFVANFLERRVQVMEERMVLPTS